MQTTTMDQFRKMYRPVLKTVRPGEKRPSEEKVPQFDFSKRFAEMVKREMDNKLSIDEISCDFKPASSKSSERVKEHMGGKIKEENEASSNSGDPAPPNSGNSAPSNNGAVTMQNAEFKPIGVPKLNLHQSDLLQLQPITRDESAGELGERSPAIESTAFTNSIPDLSSSSDSPLIDETFKQGEEMSAMSANMFDDGEKTTKMFDKENKPVRSADPPITATELDKGYYL